MTALLLLVSVIAFLPDSTGELIARIVRAYRKAMETPDERAD